MSFYYSLILLRYSSTFISITVPFIFKIIITPKITLSYWFIIIFFFMHKKIPNISNYSIFNLFIFFSLKRFLISLIVVPSIYSFSLKNSLTSLITMYSIFFIFFKSLTFNHKILRKNN